MEYCLICFNSTPLGGNLFVEYRRVIRHFSIFLFLLPSTREELRGMVKGKFAVDTLVIKTLSKHFRLSENSTVIKGEN